MLSCTSFGQANGLKFGILPQFNYNSFGAQYKDSLFAKIGVGVFGFVQKELTPKGIFLRTGISNQTLIYQSDINNGRLLNNFIAVPIVVGKSFQKMDGFTLRFSYTPQFMLFAEYEILGIQKIGLASGSITSLYENRLSSALGLGLELPLSNIIAFTFDYNMQLDKKVKNGIVFPTSNYFSAGIKVDFIKQEKTPSKFVVARENLSKLQNDTLYILNRTCGKYTRIQLEELFAKNYNFSAIRVLEDNEVQAVLTYPNRQFFALVGTFFQNETNARNTGIFMLDKDLNHLKRPYPHFIMYLREDWCMEDTEETARVIATFNKKLIGLNFAP